ncbi:hypothetical protein B0T24DRAFT_373156 [Lasiosphaeria ovina]|uniref:Uncharacterized protein n=1 Tax=Lasiosphaeria ovina TaxID=92902 RepID=A0AAE0JZM0_9PEZI|nr:hypothetical protein B0T24DRAFT_373156 [Lasiosphaeria ovina]
MLCPAWKMDLESAGWTRRRIRSRRGCVAVVRCALCAVRCVLCAVCCVLCAVCCVLCADGRPSSPLVTKTLIHGRSTRGPPGPGRQGPLRFLFHGSSSLRTIKHTHTDTKNRKRTRHLIRGKVLLCLAGPRPASSATPRHAADQPLRLRSLPPTSQVKGLSKKKQRPSFPTIGCRFSAGL